MYAKPGLIVNHDDDYDESVPLVGVPREDGGYAAVTASGGSVAGGGVVADSAVSPRVGDGVRAVHRR